MKKSEIDTYKLSCLLTKAVNRGIKKQNVPLIAKGSFDEKLLSAYVEVDEDIKNSLIEFVSGEPILNIFNGKMFNTGFGANRVDFPNLVRWLLYVTSEEGVDAAVGKLESYIEIDYTPAQQYLAISGIEVGSIIELSDSIKLIPFDSIPSCAPRDYLDPPILKPARLKEIGIPPAYIMTQPKPHIPKAALVKNTKLIPKYFSEEDRPVFFDDGRQLYEACELLTLVGNSAPVPLSHWFVLDEAVPCAQFLGSGWSSPVHDLISTESYVLTDGDVKYLKATYGKYVRLEQSIKDSLRIPMLRLNQARRKQNIADKAIDLGVAFEALFLNDRSHKEQISFTFRLRASWFLAATKTERRSLVNLFNKLYECRSKAIHTGHLDEKVKQKGMPPIPTSEFLKQADLACVKTISKIIDEAGFPDWEDIILG